MKITIVLGAFLPVPTVMGGAVEKAWLMLAEEFAARGHEVCIVSRAVPQFPKAETINGVRHIRVKGFNSPRSLLWLKCLDLIYSLRARSRLPVADILVTNTFWLPLLVRDQKKGRIYVHVARFPKGQLSYYAEASRLQAPSTSVMRAITEQAPNLAGKTVVIPYPAPRTVASSPPPSLNERPRTILFVGRLHPEKGVHLLVEAFAGGARTLFADWNVVIVGPIEEKFGGGGEQYGARLRQLGEAAGTRLLFAGSIFDGEKLEDTLRSARLFVYPSLAERGETFGLAPLEAMSQGCAALVSNLECFRDFITDGRNGFVFNHRSEDAMDALTNRIRDAISDETMLASTAQAGYEKTIEYSLPRVADRFLQDFNSTMRSN